MIKRKFISILILLMITLVGCQKAALDPFKEQYEAVNGTKSSSGKTFFPVSIPNENVYYFARDVDIQDLIKGGTGVILFGFADCPWCRNLVEVIDEAAKAVHLDKVWYLDVKSIRDMKKMNGDSVVVEKEGTKIYQEMLQAWHNDLPKYEGINDDSRRIYSPLILVVVEGKVVGSHVGTLDEQTDPFVKLTDAQRESLLTTFKDLFSKIPGCGESKNLC